MQKRVKGIILVSGSTDTSWLKDMPLQGTPVVALETRLSIAAPYVGFDYYESGKLAAEHLLSLGHRRIGVISSAYLRGNRRERLDGFVDTMRHLGIELTNKDIRVGDNVRGDGSGEVYILGQMMTDLLLENDPPPTAIYAINDTLALGALRTLEAVGIRSPEEISVLGFGNTVQSQTCTPALSTIDQRAFEMGAAATEMLLRLFDDPAAEQSDKIFRPRLLLRETTGPVRCMRQGRGEVANFLKI